VHYWHGHEYPFGADYGGDTAMSVLKAAQRDYTIKKVRRDQARANLLEVFIEIENSSTGQDYDIDYPDAIVDNEQWIARSIDNYREARKAYVKAKRGLKVLSDVFDHNQKAKENANAVRKEDQDQEQEQEQEAKADT
jgi:hypothetical protein